MASKRTWGIGKRIIASVLITTGLQACTNNMVHSKVDDAHSVLVSGTVIIRPDSWYSGSEGRGHGGIELAYEHHHGSGTQELPLDAFIQYQAQSPLSGPQTVSHNASVDHGYLGYNRLWKFGRHFQLEPSLGFAHDEINIETQGRTQNGTVTTSLRQSINGIAVSVIPRWYFNQFVGIEFPIRVGAGYASRGDSLSFFSTNGNGLNSMISPSVIFQPTKYVALSLGYANRSQSVQTDSDQSNLDLSFRGVNAALRMTF